jgi:hypothetical protein
VRRSSIESGLESLGDVGCACIFIVVLGDVSESEAEDVYVVDAKELTAPARPDAPAWPTSPIRMPLTLYAQGRFSFDSGLHKAQLPSSDKAWVVWIWWPGYMPEMQSCTGTRGVNVGSRVGFIRSQLIPKMRYPIADSMVLPVTTATHQLAFRGYSECKCRQCPPTPQRSDT